MTLHRVSLLSILLGLGLASPARSQDPDQEPTAAVPGMVLAPTALPPLGMRSPDSVILARPDVQADLRLSPEQRRRFAPLDASRRERQRDLDEMADATNRNAFSPLPLRDVLSLEAMQAESDREMDAGIAALLTRPQRARFAQIRLQLDGPMSFAQPDLLTKLNVEDDQAETIRGILETMREELIQNAQFPLTSRDVPRRDGSRPPTMTERDLEEDLARARVANERLREAAAAKIARVLSKFQWETYLKLRGAPFRQMAEIRPTAPPATARVGARNSARVADRSRPARRAGRD
jgi:hypothetical protein